MGFIIGCDIGGTAIKLVRLRGPRVEESLEVPTPARASAREFIETLERAVEEISKPGRKAGLRRRGKRAGVMGPDALGIALPGFLNPARDAVVFLSNVPALNGVKLKREMGRRTGTRVVLDADTNAGAVAEATAGAGRDHERILYLTLGTGLGAALAVGSRPVRVSHNTVGQVAHVPLDASGPRCRCGERGCAEACLSAKGILWRARKRGIPGASSPQDLWEMARARSGEARRLWREIGGLLGRLLVLLANLFSPDAIVIGGGIAQAADLFLPAAREYVRAHLTPKLGRTVAIEASRLGPFAGAVGAGLLARAGTP